MHGGVPDLLRDMRWVYHNPERATQTPSRERLQGLYRDNAESFLSKLQREEAAFRRQKREKEAVAKRDTGVAERVEVGQGDHGKGDGGRGDGGEGRDADQGGEKVRDLIGRLLEEMEGVKSGQLA